MAIEAKRGCGYRKVGGIYLVGGEIFAHCDRLPLPLDTCPYCGHGFTFNRGVTRVDAAAVFGEHDPCFCNLCNVCTPPEGISLLMWVGKSHYLDPEAFIREAIVQGISRKISNIPKDLELNKTVIYLAHRDAVNGTLPAGSQASMEINGKYLDFQPRMVEVEQKAAPSPGIFASFVPTRIERLVWQRDATEERLEEWVKRGITPVIIPDGDVDHASERRL